MFMFGLLQVNPSGGRTPNSFLKVVVRIVILNPKKYINCQFDQICVTKVIVLYLCVCVCMCLVQFFICYSVNSRITKNENPFVHE